MGCLFSKEVNVAEEEPLSGEVGVPVKFIDYDTSLVAIEDNDMCYLVKSSYF